MEEIGLGAFLSEYYGWGLMEGVGLGVSSVSTMAGVLMEGDGVRNSLSEYSWGTDGRDWIGSLIQ